MCLPILLLAACVLCGASLEARATTYESARSLGRLAAERAGRVLDVRWADQRPIVLTNAGFARPGGLSSTGCLDGLAGGTGASVGSSTLLQLPSRFDQPLWFAFYVPDSGQCAYLQMDPETTAAWLKGRNAKRDTFAVKQTARIDAAHLAEDAQAFQERAEEGLFGDNLFRVVTAANAAAADAPDDLLAAVQAHDHYCPGVTSGVLLVRYIRRHILSKSPDAECFVLGLNPWCKEDALTTLLNATPGKQRYGVLYPGENETESWPQPLKQASTVIFVRSDAGSWEGRLLGFDFAKAREMFPGPDSESPLVEKLAMDLWLLDFLDRPGIFVSDLGSVRLRHGRTPRDLLRPGADTVRMLSGSRSGPGS
jgi:formylmethanofuran dehydrogenase subunit E-like metal-binding protein